MLFVIFAKIPGVPEADLLLYLMPLFNPLSLIMTERLLVLGVGVADNPGFFVYVLSWLCSFIL